LDRLPGAVQRQALDAYRLWLRDPYHASLQFKRVHNTDPIYSVRIGIGWRALGIRQSDTVIWFWIGPHAEYDHILARL
jgi:hypothetical protein